MADRDLAAQAIRFRALGNGDDLRETAFAPVMQMNIDADAATVCDGKHHVEMAVEVAVDADRIEAADQVCSGRDRLVQQLGRAG